MSARLPRLLLLVRTVRRNALQDAHTAGARCVAGNITGAPLLPGKAGVSIGTVLCWRAPTPRDLQSRSVSQPAAGLRRSARCGAAARYDGGGLSVASVVIQPWSAEPRKAVEATGSGDVVEFLDRMEGPMNKAAFPAALLAGLALVGCQQPDSPAEHTQDSEPLSQPGDMYAGTYLGGAKRFDVASQNTGIEYSVWVQTPPKYNHKGEGEGHTLLLVMDGSMLFAGAVETAGVQASTGETHPVIVVGVSTKGSMKAHNTRRQRDYSGGTLMNRFLAQMEAAGPVTSETAGGVWPLYNRLKEAGIPVDQGFGGADRYLAFLTDELLPELLSKYNVDADEIGLAGHSMGGAFCGHTLLAKTTPFSKFVIGTFSMDGWYTPEEMAAYQQHYKTAQAENPVDVFYGYGGVEVSDFPGAVENSILFLEGLKQTDPDYVQSLLTWNFEREQHGSVAAAFIASGIHHHWGTGLSYSEAAKLRNNDEWK